MNTNYNLNNLFIEAFGEKPDKKFYSHLGTEIVHPIFFKGAQYRMYNTSSESQMVGLDTFMLPPSCIVDFSQEKIIGKTRIGESFGGTVKETFGFDDIKITIRGFCLNDPSQPQGYTTAFKLEEHLMQWERVFEGIEVVGDLFKIRNIRKINIESIKMQRLRGKPNVVPFVINALNDDDLTYL